MLELKARYGVDAGFSDHTSGPYAALAAASLGASVIEKHLTFSRKMYGSDARYAAEPDEFAELVRGIRAVEVLLANPVSKEVTSGLRVMKNTFEKSVVVLQDAPSGTKLTAAMLGCKKPGTGIPPSRLDEVVGRKTRRDVKADTLLTEADIDWESLP
jgi:N-acetylneuraminate synthase